MNKRESNLLNDLKLAVDSPKRYLANYFDEMKNQIDLECQVYLGQDELADEYKERAISEQLEIGLDWIGLDLIGFDWIVQSNPIR